MVYLGQISIFGFTFEPRDFAFCQGQLLAIRQNAALFSILGNTYGGDGVSAFALPNLPGIPIGAGRGPGRSAYQLGASGGEAALTLMPSQLPAHNHSFNAVTDQASSASPEGNQLARASRAQGRTENAGIFYSSNPGNANTALAPGTIGPDGSGQSHNNMQPYLVLNFCVSLRGILPPHEGGPAPTTPFLGELSICAFGFPPPNWALCDGRLMPIRQHQALYSLLGTVYGGNGSTTFALPDLRGRVPLGFAGNNSMGARGGEEAHVLSGAEMPSHGHALMADAISTTGISNTPSVARVLGQSSGAVLPDRTRFTANLYGTGASNAALGRASVGVAGGGQAHENRMPSLALSFCINIDPRAPYPSRN